MSSKSNISLHGREAGIDINSNRLFLQGRPFNVVMTPFTGAAASNQTCVVIQITDYEDMPVKGIYHFDLWLSDAASGAGFTAVTASGAVQNGGGAGPTPVTAAGVDLGTYTAKKALHCQSDSNGKYTLSITDTAKTAFKVCYMNDTDGQPIVGLTLATANYG